MSNPLPNCLLAVDEPHACLGDAARVFDPVLGSWDMDCVFTAADGQRITTAGEWHFGWILGGHTLQDVLYFYPKGSRPSKAADMKAGTTLRVFDSKSGQWLVTFFAGLRGEVIHLRGGVDGQRLVFTGLDVDGASLRWSFNDIKHSSLRWIGETSADGGLTWRVEQEMHLRRLPTGEVR